MNRPISIDAVALLWGAAGTSREFFNAWLRGVFADRFAISVPASSNMGSRTQVLERAVIEQVGGGRIKREADWLARQISLGDVVVASHSGEDGDFAVAIKFGTGPHSVRLKPREGGWLLPIPDVPDSIVALFSLGLGALCARHRIIPGRFPQVLRGPVIVGNAALTCETPEPLAIDEVRLGQVNTEAGLVYTAIGVTDVSVAAREMVRQNRTFDRRMALENHVPGKVAFCMAGASNAMRGQLGAWRGVWPDESLLDVDGCDLIASTCAWHIFAARLLNDCGVQADLSIGHSVGKWAARSGATFQMLNAELQSAPWRSALSKDMPAIRERYAELGRVDAATQDGDVWQAWLILGPVTIVEDCLNSPLVEIIERRGPLECVIAGHPDALDDVMLALLNSPRMHATQLEWDVALHTSASIAYGPSLARTFGFTGLDRPADVAPEVERAWNQGARIFVDIGPRASFAHWIPKILEGKAFEVVAIDPMMLGPSALIDALVRLRAMGVPANFAGIQSIMKSAPDLVVLPEARRDWLSEALDIQDRVVEAHQQFLASQRRAFDEFLDAHQALLRALAQDV